MVFEVSDALGIFIAALGGAAVGLEREWSGHASGPNARFAGIRTFTFLGLLAGLAGALWSAGVHTLAAVFLAGACMLIVAASLQRLRTFFTMSSGESAPFLKRSPRRDTVLPSTKAVTPETPSKSVLLDV